MNNSSKPSLSKEQKFVIASTATGFSFENMDFNFMSFALSSIIASLGISTRPSWMDHNDHPVGRSFRRIAVRSFK